MVQKDPWALHCGSILMHLQLEAVFCVPRNCDRQIQCVGSTVRLVIAVAFFLGILKAVALTLASVS